MLKGMQTGVFGMKQGGSEFDFDCMDLDSVPTRSLVDDFNFKNTSILEVSKSVLIIVSVTVLNPK